MTKTIKITNNNRAKIEAALANAQQRARVRKAITGDVFCAVTETEKGLAKILRKKDWDGLSFSICVHAQKFANCYKGIPEATYFTIERRSGGWHLVGICRAPCGNRYGEIRFGPFGAEGRTERRAKFASDVVEYTLANWGAGDATYRPL